MSDFNWIAPFYDRLVYLIFGKNVERAQLCFIDQIPIGAKVLILGGGTGWILEKIFKANPSCEISYVELSSAMIAIAKKRKIDHTHIHYYVGSEDVIPKAVFDVVIVNFFLDLFPGEKLYPLVDKLRQKMSPQGMLLATDFVHNTHWHGFLLWIMYRFFRWTCRIPAKKLPSWRKVLLDTGFSLQHRKSFYFGFIDAALFRGHG